MATGVDFQLCDASELTIDETCLRERVLSYFMYLSCIVLKYAPGQIFNYFMTAFWQFLLWFRGAHSAPNCTKRHPKCLLFVPKAVRKLSEMSPRQEHVSDSFLTVFFWGFGVHKALRIAQNVTQSVSCVYPKLSESCQKRLLARSTFLTAF